MAGARTAKAVEINPFHGRTFLFNADRLRGVRIRRPRTRSTPGTAPKTGRTRPMTAKQERYRALVKTMGVEGAAKAWRGGRFAENPRKRRRGGRKSRKNGGRKKAWKWTPARRAAFRRMRAAGRKSARKNPGRRRKSRKGRRSHRRARSNSWWKQPIRHKRASKLGHRRAGHHVRRNPGGRRRSRRNPSNGGSIRSLGLYTRLPKVAEYKALVQGGWKTAGKNLAAFGLGLGGSSLIAYYAELGIRQKGWARAEWQVDLARNGVRFVAGSAVSAVVGMVGGAAYARKTQLGVLTGVGIDLAATGVKYLLRAAKGVNGIDGVLALAPSRRNVALHAAGLGQIADTYEEYKILGVLAQGEQLDTYVNGETGEAAIVRVSTGDVVYQGTVAEVDGVLDGIEGYEIGEQGDGQMDGVESTYSGDSPRDGRVGEDITVES